jgi:uncharacterized protein YdaT
VRDTDNNGGETIPWTIHDYPDSLKALKAATRAKAIEIANALVALHRYGEGRAIAIATSQAEVWERLQMLAEGDETRARSDME